ncbi:DUF362 domain-containing protein [Gloeobacter morelensis]|uniref:DUF362 domain-containing protein n=1 Tax=Gloeobacter morelensis MG652769 TaxID=2781736 RepID=A0ABY3PNX5_9CYAN|nr:DUF362 domain-containing protein [Gloeobacter morelensis]UFP95268.1 DUF362 domain-containing protein [Gloeobacter morelensis MG652769]
MRVHLVDAEKFVYVPPAAAHDARQILIKPNLGYPAGPPVTVGLSVLGEVIAGIRRVNGSAEILIVEGVCHRLEAEVIARKLGLGALLSEGVRFLDADSLPCKPYPNRATVPQRFAELWAPQLLEEVDCRISVGALKRTILKEAVLMSCALKNLYGLFPRERYRARSPYARGQLHRPDVHRVICDVYTTIGILFDGAVVDGSQKFISKDWQPDVGTPAPCGKVIWGDDLLAVDREACRVAGEGMPAYLELIDRT